MKIAVVVKVDGGFIWGAFSDFDKALCAFIAECGDAEIKIQKDSMINDLYRIEMGDGVYLIRSLDVE